MDPLTTKTFLSRKPTSEIWDITPAVASLMLSTSRGNRPIRRSRVKDWARSLQGNSWEIINDDICFDLEGCLVNGHHRLTACVESGISFKCGVKRGLSLTAYSKMDCGLARSPSERTGMNKRCAEVCRLAALLINGTTRPSALEMQRLGAHGIEAAHQELLDYCGSAAKFFSCAPLRLAACAHLAHNKSDVHRQYAMATYKALVQMDMQQHPPIAQALVRQHIQGVVKAFNYADTFLRGVRVYDYEKRNISKIQIMTATNTAAAAELVHFIGYAPAQEVGQEAGQ